MILNFAGAEVGATIQMLNDSRSGYEVIGNTNPYSTYQSIHEYEIMGDFHSNIVHESSNSDLEIQTTCNAGAILEIGLRVGVIFLNATPRHVSQTIFLSF